MPANFDVFQPVQPELKARVTSYVEFIPKKDMETDVAVFYQFRIDGVSGQVPVIPDGCLDLLFICDPEEPFAFIATSPEQRTPYVFQTNRTYFGIRLYPEQRSLTLDCTVKDLIPFHQIPLIEVVPNIGSLIEEIANSQSFQDRMSVFTSYVIKNRKEKSNYCQNLINYCMNRIYAAHGLLSMKDLSVETGYSNRYIRKKFEEYVGFPPKKMSQIVRLHHCIGNMFNEKESMNKLLNYHGYYDIAHFYKEFKKYIVLTPKQYKFIG
ncbi:AraC family transcriptional regulator [Aeribacillus composti]|uniref:AraC family transcriptional regulator n=1 Tax=Aeribacillus composti TaxID=1868734 RepID=UPI002E1BAA3E|nr:AraC family transcriptional regulator [Aeribacillus composti]